MRRIILHGRLGKKFGREFKLDVATAGEAVRALGTQLDGFVEMLREGSWHVVRGSPKSGMSLDENDVNAFKLGDGDLHFIPAISGSKKTGGLLKVILGVVLVGAAFFLSGGALAAPILGGGGLLGGVTWGNLAMVGAALTIAGAAQLITPETADNKKNDSYAFGGPGNLYDQGYPVPLVYGEVVTGSVLISGGIDIENIGSYQG